MSGIQFYFLGVIIAFLMNIAYAVSTYKSLNVVAKSRASSIFWFVMLALVFASFSSWFSWILVIAFAVDYMDYKEKKGQKFFKEELTVE